MFRGALTTMKKMTKTMLRTVKEINLMQEMAAKSTLETKATELVSLKITPVQVLLLPNQAKVQPILKLSKSTSSQTMTMPTVWIPNST
jgi:hypothetical protein